jgi:SAM-dependent methyltransferase
MPDPLEEALELVAEYISTSDNPDLREYGRKTLSAARARDPRYVWILQEIRRLARTDGGSVLDIGCGFGWDAIALSRLSGCSLVLANDVRATMTSPLERFVRQKESEGVCLPVRVLTGDICELEVPAGSIDSIVCNQTIEHVHDLDRMFERCAALLRKGGRAVFSNDNNALNRRSLREIEQMWTSRDRDHTYTEQLKQERPIENAEIEPYSETRRRIVRKAQSSMSDSDIDRVVDATAGLTRAEIEAAAQRYVESGRLPVPDRLGWCRDPITGEYCERQLDPFEVAGRLRSLGFRTSVRHGFRKQPLRAFNGVGVRWINTMLFQLRPFFLIVAERC